MNPIAEIEIVDLTEFDDSIPCDIDSAHMAEVYVQCRLCTSVEAMQCSACQKNISDMPGPFGCGSCSGEDEYYGLFDVVSIKV